VAENKWERVMGGILSTWNAFDEVSIRVFLFLSIPPLIVVWIMMCSRGCSGCNCGSAGIAFLALSLVGRGRNGRRRWYVGDVGIVFLRYERSDKLVIGGKETKSRNEVLCALEDVGRAGGG
jgi:hypothetical protein